MLDWTEVLHSAVIAALESHASLVRAAQAALDDHGCPTCERKLLDAIDELAAHRIRDAIDRQLARQREAAWRAERQ